MILQFQDQERVVYHLLSTETPAVSLVPVGGIILPFYSGCMYVATPARSIQEGVKYILKKNSVCFYKVGKYIVCKKMPEQFMCCHVNIPILSLMVNILLILIKMFFYDFCCRIVNVKKLVLEKWIKNLLEVQSVT